MFPKPLIFATLVAVASSQSVPSCFPYTVDCLVSQAQFSILGTVTGTTLQDSGSSPSNYNATMSIDCVYSSFSNPVSDILVGRPTVEVSSFGRPRTNCPNGGGAEAEVGVKKVYYIYLANRPSPTVEPIFAVFDICQGGSIGTEENLQVVSNIVNNPNNERNRILQGSNCTLPAFQPSSLNDEDGGSSLGLPGAAVKLNAVGVVVATISFLILFLV